MASVDTPEAAGYRPRLASDEPWPAAGQAWYAVFVCSLALLVNFLDRGILPLLVQSIKADLKLSDLQISLIMGFAFVAFYVILGLPIARLVDYKSRKLILAVGITCWSLMTAACGLAGNFWQLFGARVGVGVGEACQGPGTFSLLADYFPKEKLPKAIAVLNFGYTTGNGLALIIGGAVIAVLSTLPPVTLPILGLVKSWQLTFFAVGIPGLIVAFLLTTIKEPARRGIRADGSAGGDARPVPVREVAAFVKHNAGVFLPMFAGLAMQTMLSFGNAGWVPAFYQRTYGWTNVRVGLVQGAVYLIVWPIGAMLGGALAERWARKGLDDANMRVAVLAALLTLPGNILFPLMPTAELAVAVSVWNGLCAALVLGPQNAALQVITPGQMRGQITALFLFVFNVLGFGCGPVVVALFTRFLFHSEADLRYSMATAAATLGPLTVLLLFLALKPYGRSVARARAWS